MADLNQITITGRLVRDAVLKNINGKNLLTFDVANNIGYGQYQKTNFYTVNRWGDSGLKIAQYLTKGSGVGVTGQESMNEWTGGDGVSHSSRVITAHDIIFLGSSSNKKEHDDSNVPTGESQDDYPAF